MFLECKVKQVFLFLQFYNSKKNITQCHNKKFIFTFVT